MYVLNVARFVVYTLALMMLISISSPLLAGDIAIVAHPTVVIRDLNPHQARLIWSLALVSTDDRVKLRVFSFNESSDIHRKFTRNYLKLRSAQLSRQWSRAAFSGNATPPVLVESSEQMLRLVSEVPGAIGYVPKQDINKYGQYKVVLIKTKGMPK